MAQQSKFTIHQELLSSVKINNQRWNIHLFEDKNKTELCENCGNIYCDAVELGCEHDEEDHDIYSYSAICHNSN